MTTSLDCSLADCAHRDAPFKVMGCDVDDCPLKRDRYFTEERKWANGCEWRSVEASLDYIKRIEERG